MKASELKMMFGLNDEDLKEIRGWIEFFNNGMIIEIEGVKI